MAAAPRTLVVGDVHGCFHELLELLAKMNWRPSIDQVVLAGDMVGKGPEVKSVLKFARHNHFLAVKGNFEVAWLHWHEEPEKRRLSAVDAAQAKQLDASDWAWLASLPFYFRLPEFGVAVVHAGCVPGVSLEKQESHVLTHLRCLAPDGRPLEAFTGNDRLWAKHWNGPELLIFGHDAMRGLQQERMALGLDTGVVYGNCLSAVELPSRAIVSVKARQMYSQPKEKSKL